MSLKWACPGFVPSIQCILHYPELDLEIKFRTSTSVEKDTDYYMFQYCS